MDHSLIPCGPSSLAHEKIWIGTFQQTRLGWGAPGWVLARLSLFSEAVILGRTHASHWTMNSGLANHKVEKTCRKLDEITQTWVDSAKKMREMTVGSRDENFTKNRQKIKEANCPISSVASGHLPGYSVKRRPCRSALTCRVVAQTFTNTWIVWYSFIQFDICLKVLAIWLMMINVYQCDQMNNYKQPCGVVPILGIAMSQKLNRQRFAWAAWPSFRSVQAP